MKYQHKSFSVSMLANRGTQAKADATCRSHGHMEPDQRGKCLRCGVKIRFAFSKLPPPVDQIDYQRKKDREQAVANLIEAAARHLMGFR